MNTAELVQGLVDSLATRYPARLSALSNQSGRVTCVVAPVRAVYETPVCPGPLQLEVDVHVVAAGSDDQAVTDMLQHLDAVADLIRAAGFTTTDWTAGNNQNRPETVIAAVASATG